MTTKTYVYDYELKDHNVPFTAAAFRKWRLNRTGPPYYRVGRCCLYDPAEVLEWIAEHKICGR